MAKRYDQKTKAKVISFVKTYNEKNGRGGQTAAAKKYSINPISIKAWMDADGYNPQKDAKANAHQTSNSRKSSKKSPASPSSVKGILLRMTEIQDEVNALREEIEKKEREYELLKKRL